QRYAALISNFPSGDYLFHTDSVSIDQDHVTNNIFMLCYGDVNASYEPTGAKSNQVNLIFEDMISVSPFTEFILPVILKTEAQIGAVSLAIHYPENYLDILDVNMANGNTNIIWSVQNGLLKIAWCNLNAMNLEDNEVLLTITCKTKDLVGMTNGILLGLSNECELADENAQVINNVILSVPEIHSATSLAELELNIGFNFSVYPNPMSDFSKIEFSIERQSYVKIGIYNILGALVKTVENSVFPAGKHTIDLYLPEIDKGIYMLKMTYGNSNYSYNKTIRLVISE
ncbi:MAG: T9SS type A sorting domain-containing protein, partial [Bacteroidales bacterium]|nr:T9SS type A sorting domain-containing protein [Bacteroidales bacterium]